MSERLTDEELAKWADWNIDHKDPVIDDDLFDVRSMAVELRDRRAQDLSAEEVVALRYLREHVQFIAPVSHQTPGMEMNRAVFALDKLIAAAEARR